LKVYILRVEDENFSRRRANNGNHGVDITNGKNKRSFCR